MKKSIFTLILSFSIIIVLSGMSRRGVTFSDGNVVYVNNVKLKVKNTTTINSTFDAKEFRHDGGSGSVSLTGNSGEDCELTIEYFEYSEGDAEIYLKNGELAYKTLSGKPAYIHNIQGVLPDQVDIWIDSGSGDIDITGFDNEKIYVDIGSGDCTLRNCNQQSKVLLDSGSGELRILDSSNIDTAELDTGSGQVYVNNLKSIGYISIDTGSGDVSVEESIAKTLYVDTGSGDVIISNSNILYLNHDTGSGDVIIRNSEIESTNGDADEVMGDLY